MSEKQVISDKPGSETWHCDTCGEEAMYRANGVCYCDQHWEDYLFKI